MLELSLIMVIVAVVIVEWWYWCCHGCAIVAVAIVDDVEPVKNTNLRSRAIMGDAGKSSITMQKIWPTHST